MPENQILDAQEAVIEGSIEIKDDYYVPLNRQVFNKSF